MVGFAAAIDRLQLSTGLRRPWTLTAAVAHSGTPNGSIRWPRFPLVRCCIGTCAACGSATYATRAIRSGSGARVRVLRRRGTHWWPTLALSEYSRAQRLLASATVSDSADCWSPLCS